MMSCGDISGLFEFGIVCCRAVVRASARNLDRERGRRGG